MALLCPASHTLNPATAEDPFRSHHQHRDHQHIRSKVLGAAADVGVEITSCEVFDNTNEQPSNNGAYNRIKPAENDHREHLKADQRKLVVDAEHRSPDDAA